VEKRFIVFILFCAFFIPAYMNLFMPPVEKPSNPTPGEPASLATALPGAGPAGDPAPVAPARDAGSTTASTAAPTSAPEPEPDFEAVTRTLVSEQLRLTVDSLGASVRSVELVQYREEDGEAVLSLLGPQLASERALLVDLVGGAIEADLQDTHWELIEEREGELLVFRHPLPGGRAVVKELRLPRGGFELEVGVRFEGEFPKGTDVPYRLLGPERIRHDVSGYRSNARVVGIQNARGEFNATDHEAVGLLAQGVRFVQEPALWIGLESNYFACVVRPIERAAGALSRAVEVGIADASQGGVVGGRDTALQKYPFRVGFQTPIRSGETDRYRVFLGPKDPDVLRSFEAVGYLELIDYGALGLLVRLFLFLLRTFEALVSSWGVAIILLTVVVKAFLHPINKKNQRGMQRQQKKMARVQPQMKALREKHKNDPLKANQEIQKLFREHGINPAQMAGGCLMLFLQLPIWIGLLSTFRIAIELRQAPFLYIADLTAPDRLGELPFALPFLGSDFNLLPILYVIVTLVNQRMMPKSDDPNMRQQQKMMTFMMVAFGFIFYSFASGLLLYFLTSATLGLVEQKIIRAELAREEDEGDGVVVKAPATPPPPKPGKPIKRRS